MSLATLQALYGTELLEMISVQTMSNWDGFDGYMDGLVITLTDGTVGRVDFHGPVPEPGALGLVGLGLIGLVRRKRRS